MSPLQPYSGIQRKLVLALDIGTTFSGVSYAILDHGEIPTIRTVTRYPGQENAAGDSKIPSILYYSPNGTVHSIGAEADEPGMALVAEDEDLVFVEWQGLFQRMLHLRPDALGSDEIKKADIPKLPPGKTVVQVLSDFMEYLYRCAKRFIIESHASGDSLWSSVEDRIDFVLSHPNGWEGPQQQHMRRAATLAGLVPDTLTGQSRIHFVTEGEASLYYCVSQGLVENSIQNGQTVMIVDAGGGTVDLSVYNFASVAPLSIEEVAAPECLMQGSTRVNIRARSFLKEKLQHSRFGNDEDIQTMVEFFNKSTKAVFKNSDEPSYIKFGTMGSNDPSVQIRRGQMILSGHDVASFFEPSIRSIVDTIRAQHEDIFPPLTAVFLVGGFAASPWLFSQLQQSLTRLGLTVSRPDRHTNKAVAEGAVAFFLTNWVSARVARLTYGVECSKQYNENDPEHLIRRTTIVNRPSGRRMIPNSFSVLLSKGTRVRDNGEVYQEFYKEARDASQLNRITSEITCYRGRNKKPRWTDTEPEMFSSLCTVVADTSKVYKSKKFGPVDCYYSQEYKVVLLCGLTELKAQIAWIEDGEERRGPATIVYDDDAEALN
ncbi:hypothetical protein WOLCODRAFT_157373 [Wolfiporia cocos MD-104 SS10]|uniref:Actin-like ATPase domain-containing protein n=1 Tax=Wolfiporia cocos (strain MD-104) TaxID=742152 RepID=A0A2H3JJ15_WOLCO|nr:hypothetical protein WOLCODRAFT_157373 [Wolfiporia cocos MD-104 SS10]